jgi:hypothetical protein
MASGVHVGIAGRSLRSQVSWSPNRTVLGNRETVVANMVMHAIALPTWSRFMSHTTLCLADTAAETVAIIDALRAAGIPTEDISVMMPERHRSQLTELGGEGVAIIQRQSVDGAVIGAATGGVVGSAAAWLAGIGTVLIPGIGPLLAAGPFMTLLTGIGVGASLGGMAGALVGLGIPESDAARYQGHLLDGRIVITVRTGHDDQTTRAAQLMQREGGQEISCSR